MKPGNAAYEANVKEAHGAAVAATTQLALAAQQTDDPAKAKEARRLQALAGELAHGIRNLRT